MSFEERNAWIMGAVTIVSYATYLIIVVGRAQGLPITAVPYVATMLWTIGGAIVASILLGILAAIMSREDRPKRDVRDREIHRFGEYTGQAFVIVGGVAALGMSMAELSHFWISNAIYLGFVLSAILGSVAKIVAYRRGFQPC